MCDVTIAFVHDLAKRFAALEPLLRDHIDDNFGEVLPHIFFSSLTRYAVGLIEPSVDPEGLALSPAQLAAFHAAMQSKNERDRREELSDLLLHLENAYASCNEEIRNLIAVSFVENLPYAGEPGSEILGMLGPRLAEQLRIWLGVLGR